jgi:hypothetical protein
MLVACLVTEVTNIISGFLIFTAFPRQKWLYERARTQAHTEEVQRKQRVQTESAYYGKLYPGNDYKYS